jgi:opacity protein-like surface antigen
MQVDAGVLSELFREIPIKPYLGFSIGVMENKNSDFTDRGLLYGINTGINYVVNNSIDIDFGYRYMSADKFKYIDNRGDFTLSLHYYFQ